MICYEARFFFLTRNPFSSRCYPNFKNFRFYIFYLENLFLRLSVFGAMQQGNVCQNSSVNVFRLLVISIRGNQNTSLTLALIIYFLGLDRTQIAFTKNKKRLNWKLKIYNVLLHMQFGFCCVCDFAR